MKKDDIIYSKASISKIQKKLGWRPKISLEKGIEKLIQNEK